MEDTTTYSSNRTINGVKVISRSSIPYDHEVKQALDLIYLERLLKDGSCTVCKTKTSKFCSKCGTNYCCIECQQLDWIEHKSVCPTLSENLTPVGSGFWSTESNNSGLAEKSSNEKIFDKKKKGNVWRKDVKNREQSVDSSSSEPCNPAKKNININKQQKYVRAKSSGKVDHAGQRWARKKSVPPLEAKGDGPWTVPRRNNTFGEGDVIQVKCLEWERKVFCWVILQENVKIFERIQVFLAQNHENYSIIEPNINDIFIIRYNGDWYRGTLLSAHPKVIVQCIDTGIKFSPKFYRCKELDPKIASIERLAFQIRFVENVTVTELPENLAVEVINIGKTGVVKVTVRRDIKLLQSIDEINDKDYALKLSPNKKYERPRRSVFDDMKPGMSGVFTTMHVQDKEIVGCLIPEDMEDAKFCYKKIRSLFCVDADETDAEVGDFIMVADIENLGQRGVVKSKSKQSDYTVTLIDYGHVVHTAKVYKLPSSAIDLVQLGCKVSVMHTYSNSFSFDVNIHYFFNIQKKVSEGRWLSLLRNEPNSDEADAECILEKIEENFPPRMDYVPLKSGCRVIISTVCEDSSKASVFVRRVDGGWKSRLREMGLKINNLPLNTDKTFWNSIKVGDIVSSKYEVDGLWYRATILSKETDTVKILFIDYGNEQIVGPNDLKPLPADIKEEPIFSYRVTLRGSAGRLSVKGFQYLQTVVEESRELVMLYDKDISEGVTLMENGIINLNEIVLDKLPSERTKCLDPFTENFFLDNSFAEGPVKRFLVLYVDEDEFMEKGVFWATDSARKYFDFIITDLGTQISEYCKTQVEYSPKIGELCFGLFEDDWYRGVATKIYGGDFEIFFVDFGNTSVLHPRSIRKMVPRYFETPPAAVKCILNGYDMFRKDQIQTACKYLQERVSDCVTDVSIEKVVEDGCYVHMPELLNIIHG